MEELGSVVTDSGHRLDLYLRSNKILVLGANASVPVLEIDADSLTGQIIYNLMDCSQALECYFCGDISKEMYCNDCASDRSW